MANKHMKRGSTLLVIREMQMETRVKYHYTPIRMAKMARLTMPSTGEHVEKLDHLFVADGNVKRYKHSGEQFGSFFKN